MAIIKFTTTVTDAGVRRRYGQWTVMALKKGGVSFQGVMDVSLAEHGDLEIEAMFQAAALAFKDAGLVDVSVETVSKDEAPDGRPFEKVKVTESMEKGDVYKRGSGEHKRHGPFIGYVAKVIGLTVKITESGADFSAPAGGVVTTKAEALGILAMFSEMNERRARLRSDVSKHKRRKVEENA